MIREITITGGASIADLLGLTKPPFQTTDPTVHLLVDPDNPRERWLWCNRFVPSAQILGQGLFCRTTSAVQEATCQRCQREYQNTHAC